MRAYGTFDVRVGLANKKVKTSERKLHSQYNNNVIELFFFFWTIVLVHNVGC